MKYLRAFGQFWYDFIIGDDWKIAGAVVISLAIAAAALLLGASDTAVTLLACGLILLTFSLALVIDQGWPRRD